MPPDGSTQAIGEGVMLRVHDGLFEIAGPEFGGPLISLLFCDSKG